MSTPARNVREIEARMHAGVAGRREMEQLLDLVKHLTWRQLEDESREPVRICRHCGQPSTIAHADWCAAEGVE